MSPFIFLIDTLFSIYTMVVLMRFLLQLVKADFYNPISQFVVAATNPLLKPMRKIIPGFGGIDNASLVLATLLTLVKVLIISAMTGVNFTISQLTISVLFMVFSQTIDLLVVLLVVMAVLSWIGQSNNPLLSVVHQITEPLIRPIRRIMPPIGGLDLSPMFLIIGLMFFKLVVQELVSKL